ncbi:uncharacterized protein [Onthophagus taurus]|uniref:uncharacterized protein n=1 Tax=Onthophagus taurus TaxID=166361 RepID=UPI0039BE2991
MLRNIFRQSISIPQQKEASTQCEGDATQTSLLWTQTENIFGLIESYIEQFLSDDSNQIANIKHYEERLNLFYQLLGTVIVEKESEQFQRKIEIDLKLAQCRYKVERSKGLTASKTLTKGVNEELGYVLNVLENFKRTKVEFTKENFLILNRVKDILDDLTENRNEIDRQFSFSQQTELSILHKLKTIQSFWKTIYNNLQPSISKECRENIQIILQSLNIEIVLKLKELHVDADDIEPVSINTIISNELLSIDNDDEDEDLQPFKDPARMHTFDTLQIARKTVKLKNNIAELIRELEGNDISKYERLKKMLDKCQDGFEEIESHHNTDLIALRTETFNKLLAASKMTNDLYEKKLLSKN